MAVKSKQMFSMEEHSCRRPATSMQLCVKHNEAGVDGLGIVSAAFVQITFGTAGVVRPLY